MGALPIWLVLMEAFLDRRRPTRFGPTASAAWLQGVGGSILAFTSYLTALRRRPISLVTT